jgi:hypothetical protein
MAVTKTILAFFQSLFEDKLVDDDRDPLFKFPISGVDGMFGLYAPKGELWKQLAYIVLIQTPIQCAFAAVIHKIIIQNRGTMFAYLVGWSFIIPVACYMPYALLEFLDVRNKIVKLAASNTMSIVAFRCIEAMYGTSPAVVETSVFHYIAYYTTMVPFYWEEKNQARRKITSSELIVNFSGVLLVFHVLSVYLSFLMHNNYKPFGDRVELDQFHFNTDLLNPAHLANGYLHVGKTNMIITRTYL